MINNTQILEKDVQDTIKKLRALEKHFSAKERRPVLIGGAKILVSNVRNNIPEADEDVYRYSTPKVKRKKRAPKGHGNVVAVYTPGNARRSYRVLPLRKTEDVYVGPKVAKKSTHGIFSGNRVDGYYFHILEFGSRFQSAVAPIRRGLTQSIGQINHKLRTGFEKHMSKYESKHTTGL